MKSILRKCLLSPKLVQEVLTNDGLSAGAKNLYTYLYTLPNGSYIDAEHAINNNVVVSEQMYNKYRRELEEDGLVHSCKDRGTNIRFIYLGSYQFKADILSKKWLKVAL